MGTRAVFGILSIAALPLLLALGCQGSLEGNFPAQSGSNGSGGSSTGSGGSSTGSGGGSGSGGSSGSGGATAAACDVPTKVFMAHNCSNSGCHAGGVFDTAPNLLGSNVGSMLKGMTATLDCAGDKYIDPASPKNSVLYKIIATREACMDQMPLGSPLEGSDLTNALSCLEDWISKQ
jgi:hypothetical protein